jgi:hypothetical protein
LQDFQYAGDDQYQGSDSERFRCREYDGGQERPENDVQHSSQGVVHPELGRTLIGFGKETDGYEYQHKGPDPNA